jgi:hypothetical protein
MQIEEQEQPRRCRVKIPIGSGGIVVCPVGGPPVLISVVEKDGKAVTVQVLAVAETKVLRTEQLSGKKRETLEDLEGGFRGWFKRWGYSLRGRRFRFIGWNRSAEFVPGDSVPGADEAARGTETFDSTQSNSGNGGNVRSVSGCD